MAQNDKDRDLETVKIAAPITNQARDSTQECYSNIRNTYGEQYAEAFKAGWISLQVNGSFARDPQLQAAQDQLKQYVDAFEKLKKQAAPLAVVLSVRADKIVIDCKGQKIETEKPAGKVFVPGQTVRLVGDTLQILDIIDEPVDAGEVVTVTRVANTKTCEVDRAGSSRAVAYGQPVEEGDRVVLDASGSVVVANLGKPANDCAFAEATGVTWDDIGGLSEAKRVLREAIEAPIKHAETFSRYGKKPIKGVLLYGAPGCGKTMLGKAAATALAELHGVKGSGAFSYVKGPELLNMYVGNSESNIRKLFDVARRYKKKHGHPAIIFVDEADAILGQRGGLFGSLSSTLVPAFLAEMDGLEDSGALVLLATNRPNTLDPAVVRDGRIDRRIKVSRPSRDDAREILLKHLAGKPLAMDADEAASTLSTELYDPTRVLYRVRKTSSVGKGVPMTFASTVSGAMLAGLVDRATSLALHRELGGGAVGVVEEDLRGAVSEAFQQAIDVNHEEEIFEFINGWEHEVEAVTREGSGGGKFGGVVTLSRGSTGN